MDVQRENMSDFDETDDEMDERQYEEKARIVSSGFERKMSEVGSKLRFAQDLIALWRYFTDSSVPWQRKIIVVSALLYFILPLDAIPDLSPFFGYLDDFGVIVAVTRYMADQLAPYYPL
ncbi:MAG: YkvA family protein [Bacteroidota bacterium]|nr:YkvA family protein [Bacteroidota bacterium]